jgi:cbb3-type cytochrome oxidase subunit 3
MLTQPYRQMLMDYTTYPKPIQAVLILVLSLAAILVIWSCIRTARRNELAASAPDWTLVILLALMPVFAFVLGKTVTHALEVRHSIGAIVAISSVSAIALTPALRQQRVFATIITVMLIGIVVINTFRIRASAADDRKTMADLTLTPQLNSAIDALPDRNIYFQDLGKWELASLYEPDPTLRSRLVLVYSRDEEMANEQHDTMYLTAIHTNKFSPQPIVSYDDLRSIPGDHVFATYHGGWDWTDAAFATEAAHVEPLGHGFGGEVMKVQFK